MNAPQHKPSLGLDAEALAQPGASVRPARRPAGPPGIAGVGGARRVLLLTSGLGSGHVRAVKAVEEAWCAANPQITVHVLDFWSLIDPGVADVIQQSYLRLVSAHPDLYDRVYYLDQRLWRALLAGARCRRRCSGCCGCFPATHPARATAATEPTADCSSSCAALCRGAPAAGRGACCGPDSCARLPVPLASPRGTHPGVRPRGDRGHGDVAGRAAFAPESAGRRGGACRRRVHRLPRPRPLGVIQHRSLLCGERQLGGSPACRRLAGGAHQRHRHSAGRNGTIAAQQNRSN